MNISDFIENFDISVTRVTGTGPGLFINVVKDKFLIAGRAKFVPFTLAHEIGHIIAAEDKDLFKINLGMNYIKYIENDNNHLWGSLNHDSIQMKNGRACNNNIHTEEDFDTEIRATAFAHIIYPGDLDNNAALTIAKLRNPHLDFDKVLEGPEFNLEWICHELGRKCKLLKEKYKISKRL